jgi:hypothetical protein
MKLKLEGSKYAKRNQGLVDFITIMHPHDFENELHEF